MATADEFLAQFLDGDRAVGVFNGIRTIMIFAEDPEKSARW